MESDTSVHTYWTTCSKLGSKSCTHPHTTPKPTVIHTPHSMGAKSPKYADSLAGAKGRIPPRKGQEEREESRRAAEAKEERGTRESQMEGKEKEEREGGLWEREKVKEQRVGRDEDCYPAKIFAAALKWPNASTRQS